MNVMPKDKRFYFMISFCDIEIVLAFIDGMIKRYILWQGVITYGHVDGQEDGFTYECMVGQSNVYGRIDLRTDRRTSCEKD